ncbi:unnamed protein product [Cuscuta epithymum]|uniref:Glabrous enhancer-binding protein-like DBD domain-containing protein n=1 Tax=Cuscuta epithymum TaxID=186058 RepID=A0AAV0CAZ0_9ASTE|nr:unnamed protein product [Cuscuta epithymum]
MAPKSKTRLVDQPPSASSSEQDGIKSEQKKKIDQLQHSESESDDTSEGKKPGKRKRAPPIFKKKSAQKPQSSPEASDEESDSDSQESHRPPSAAGITVQPDLTPKQPSVSSSKVPGSLKPSSSPHLKRALHTVEEESRKKKSRSDEEDVLTKEKKSAHNRLWSNDDQIAMLKGMIDYKAQTGTDPNADFVAFNDFIMDKLDISFSKAQIKDKIKRLKKKFLTLYEKGDVPTSAKPHESKVYELSAKIWGTESNTNAKSPGGTGDIAKPEAKFANEKVKRLSEVNKISNSKKSIESTNIMDTPKAASEKKKTTAHKDKEKEKKKKKQNTHPEEEDEKRAVEKHDEQIAVVEKDKQTAANGKGNRTAGKGKDNHSASKAKDSQTAAKGKDNHSSSKAKDSQPAANGKVGKGEHTTAKKNLNQAFLKYGINGEAKNETGDFQSKYPCLVRSFNKENYPFSTQETLDMLKEKVNLIESSQAGEVEEKWAKLLEEQVAHCVKAADLVALQTRLLFDAMKR